jgi:ABC-type nitrate/sulfonate/bicarbonate transport system permease component
MTIGDVAHGLRTRPVGQRWPLSGYALGALGIVGFLGIWQLYAMTLARSLDSAASPVEAMGALPGLVSDGLVGQLGHTVGVTLIGWVLAMCLGGALGLVIGLSSLANRFMFASVEVLRAIPSIAFIPVALMVFGFSQRMELAIAVYVSQWPILIALIGGIRSVNGGFIDVARTFRLSRRATVIRVILPAAMSSFLVGMRLSLTLSVAMVVVAEMLGNPAGLGYGIVFAAQSVRPDAVFAYLVVIGLVGWALNMLFVASVRKLAPEHAGGL